MTGSDDLDLDPANDFLLRGIVSTNQTTEFFRADGTWAVPAGGSGFTTADNGLTASSATNVQLGGTLLHNTDIAGGAGAFNLNIGTTGSRLNDVGVFSDESFFVSANSGFTQLNIDDTDGSVSFQVGKSGSTSSRFSVTNGSQTTTSAGTFVVITKQNPVATNNVPSRILELVANNSGGDGAVGYGIHIDLGAENSGGGGDETIGQMIWTYLDATPTSEDTEFHMNIQQAGTEVSTLSIQAVGSVIHYTLNDLPTACAGLPTGVLANVAGVLTVCP